MKNHDGQESERVMYEIALNGDTKYTVKRVVSHIQDLDEDRVYNLLTSKFTKGMQLTIHKPDGLEVSYFPVGLADELDPTVGNNPRKLSVSYNQLMFPNQGVILIFEQ